MAIKHEKINFNIKFTAIITTLIVGALIYKLNFSIITDVIKVDLLSVINSFNIGAFSYKLYMIVYDFKLFDFMIDFFILFSILLIPMQKINNTIFEWWYQDKKEYTKKLRGSEKWEENRLSKQILKDYSKKESKDSIKLNDKLFIPKDFENRSTLIIGSPGSGKSVLLRNIIAQIVTRKTDKIIIIDRKPEFLENFFNPNTDLMFYPKSVESLNWDFGNEISNREDIRFFVDSLIPLREDEKQPVFPLSAQLVLEGILLFLKDNGTLSNKGLIDFLRRYKKPDEILEILQRTLENYALNLEPYLNDESNFSGSVIATLLAQFQKQFIIEDFYYENSDFSINDFLTSDKYQKMFLVNRSSESNLYNGYYTLFISFLSRKIKSLSNNTSRRIWFIADEFQTLKTQNNRGLGSLLSLLSEGRQKGSSVILATQSLSQIRRLYQDTGLNSIFNTTNNKIFLQNQTPEEQKIITDLFGTVEQIEYSGSTSFASNIQQNDKTSMSRSIKEKKVVLPSELAQLKTKPLKNGAMSFEAYCKLGHYPVTKFEYKTYNHKVIYELEIKDIQSDFEPLSIVETRTKKKKKDVKENSDNKLEELKKLDENIINL